MAASVEGGAVVSEGGGAVVSVVESDGAVVSVEGSVDSLGSVGSVSSSPPTILTMTLSLVL